MSRWTFRAGAEETAVPAQILITGVVIERVDVIHLGTHDVVRVFNRGALAGELRLNDGDGKLMALSLGLTEEI